jgi:hypothetical protein
MMIRFSSTESLTCKDGTSQYVTREMGRFAPLAGKRVHVQDILSQGTDDKAAIWAPLQGASVCNFVGTSNWNDLTK